MVSYRMSGGWVCAGDLAQDPLRPGHLVSRVTVDHCQGKPPGGSGPGDVDGRADLTLAGSADLLCWVWREDWVYCVRG